MEQRDYLIILYDFYGELLSDDNKGYFEDYYFDNLSLGEISDNAGISRNAVHKHIKSCEAKLMFYEEKLRLYDKDKKLRNLLRDINDEEIKNKIQEIFN